MLLVAIRFTHSGPKSSESGIKRYVVAETIDQVIDHLKSKPKYGIEGWENYLLEDVFKDEDEGSVSVTTEWMEKNADKLAEAEALGFEVDRDIGYVTGPTGKLVVWYGGNDFIEESEYYYGVTQYEWREQREITAEDADTLVRLGLAERL